MLKILKKQLSTSEMYANHYAKRVANNSFWSYINKNHDTRARLSVSNHYHLLAWMHGANIIVAPRVKTRPEGHSWSNRIKKIHKQVLRESSELTTMTSVSVRFEGVTASHRFELQSETKDDHQQSRKLRKCLSCSRCRKPKRVLVQVT